MMNLRRCFVVRAAASLAAVLLLSPGCGSDPAGLFTGSSGSGTGGEGASATGAGGTSSATGMTTGTGGASTGTGGTGGGCSQVWYCDGDQDAYGDPNVSVMSCDPPPGGDTTCPGPYLASATDCGPGDAAAHPDQMSYFGTPVLPPPPSPAFDYNCDGMEEKDPTQLYNGGIDMSCTNCFSPMASRGYGPNAQCGGTTEYYRCTFSFGMCMLIMGMAPEPLRCR